MKYDSFTTNTYITDPAHREILTNLIQKNGERFVTLDELGSGGFGSVLSVYDKWLKTNVALKVSSDPSANLETDILRLRSLPSQYFVRPFDFGKTDKYRWYSMELLNPDEGWHSLSRFDEIICAEVSPDPSATFERALFALFIAKEICFGLSELHKNRISGKNFYHGDIKPENVFFNINAIKNWRDRRIGAQGPYVKIIDLGASNECGHPSTIFTPRYAAPEQGSGEACFHKVDSYAVAKIIWRLLDLDDYAGPNGITLNTVKERLNYSSPFLEDLFGPLLYNAAKARPDSRCDCEDLAESLSYFFEEFFTPKIWRMVRFVEKQKDCTVKKADLIKAMERELIFLRYGKVVSANIRTTARDIVKNSTNWGVLFSKGHGLLGA